MLQLPGRANRVALYLVTDPNADDLDIYIAAHEASAGFSRWITCTIHRLSKFAFELEWEAVEGVRIALQE